MVNTILKEADLFCPNSVRINFTIYQISILVVKQLAITFSFYTKVKRN
ncbi:Aspartate aminotransferase [Lactiplantibacillus plantarum]|nr:Aspartate aminotransferase [Lactiplantibacillus plantarum]KZU41175.1 Aspartate aminotransferase [Lactiplantibacillus plantarum]